MTSSTTLRNTILLGLLTLVAYAPALRGPVIFDDVQTIQANASIHQLWPLSVPLSPPHLTPMSGRPVANYSFALDFGLNQLLGVDQRDDPDGPNKTIAFHLTNLLIHLCSGLLLLGIIRRTLRTSTLKERWSANADGVALFVTALWLLHPLQSEAVDYLTQRTELLVSLCYLATLYASIRAWDTQSARSRIRWYVAGIAACLLGMGSKEVMVSAPLMVMLYDRAFMVASWRDLFGSARRWFYAGLFGSLVVLFRLLAGSPRSATAGFNLGIPWYEYLHSQGWAIAHYLRLLFWPSSLSLDYGPYPIPHWRGIPGLVLLTMLFGLTCFAWTRVKTLGWAAFLGAWFFLILAPSSSVLTVATEIAAERRIYLALAAVLVALVIACITALARRQVPIHAMRLGGLALIGACAAFTFQRSRIYENNEAIWRDAIAKVPDNARAYNNLGVVVGNLAEPRLVEAESLYQHALALDPVYVNAMNNLAITEIGLTNLPEAERWYRRILNLEPQNRAALNGLGNVLLWRGDTTDALPLLERVGQNETTPEFLINLSSIYRAIGRPTEQVRVLEDAINRFPARTDLDVVLGGLLLQDGNAKDAAKFLYHAVEQDPGSGVDRALLGLADADMGRDADAVRLANQAVQEASNDERVYYFAGRAMMDAHRADLAEPMLGRAMAMDPQDADAAVEFGKVEAALGKKPRR